MDLPAKVAAFCRELADSTLSDMAGRQKDMETAYRRAEESLKAGRTGPELEADLDALDAMVRKETGQSLYPSATRTFQQLPSYTPLSPQGTGAQWWTCPHDWCTGRGRVRPGQDPPSCGVTGEPLVAGPLPG